MILIFRKVRYWNVHPQTERAPWSSSGNAKRIKEGGIRSAELSWRVVEKAWAAGVAVLVAIGFNLPGDGRRGALNPPLER